MSFYTPVMNMQLPTVGVDTGPTWATLINGALQQIDGHNHTGGIYGAQLNSSSFNITTSLPLNNNLLISTKGVQFVPSTSPALNGMIYETAAGDFHYINSSGVDIPITTGNSLAASSGNISGLSAPASASYSGVSSSFIWQSNTNTSADMNFGNAIMSNKTAGANTVTVQPPSSVPASYTVVLPALPSAGTYFTTLASSGGVATLAGSVSTTGGIIGSNVASQTITRTNLASVGQQVSSACNSFSITGTTSFTQFTNLSVTITTTGRPVMLMMQSSSMGQSLFRMIGGSPPQTATVSFTRGGGTIAGYGFSPAALATGGSGTYWPANLLYLDAPAAGTYTYTAGVALGSSGDTFIVNNLVLMAYEL